MFKNGGAEVKAFCRPLEFFHTNLCLYGPCLVHRGIVMLGHIRAPYFQLREILKTQHAKTFLKIVHF